MNEPLPGDPTATARVKPAALDYARPEPKRLPSWATRPLSLEGAVLIWVLCSVGFRFLESRVFYPHLVFGLTAYGIAALCRWRVSVFWRFQGLLAFSLLAVGFELFVSQWRDRWDFSIRYWTTYDQTYLWNRDASLRVAWVPVLGLAWLSLVLLAGNLCHRHDQQ